MPTKMNTSSLLKLEMIAPNKLYAAVLGTKVYRTAAPGSRL